jgi:tetratricopeptide (TPR) repeat protein
MIRSTEPAPHSSFDLPQPYIRLLSIAERDPRRAARLAAALLHADPSPPAHFTRGLIDLRWERISTAQTELAAATPAALPDQPYAELLLRQAQGEVGALEPAWMQVFAAELHAGRRAAAVRALNELVATLNVLGRHQDAYDLAREHADLVETDATPGDRARYVHVLGVAAGNCGDLPTGFAGLDRAEALFRALRRPIDVARVRFERAWLHQRREDQAAARADLVAALITFTRFDLPLRVAFAQKDLAQLAMLSGDYPAALDAIAQARNVASRFERRDLLAYCEHLLGVIAQYSGLWDLALAAYARAQAIYREGNQERLYLICERNRAMVLNAQDRSSESLAVLDAIAAPVAALADRLEIAEGMQVRASALRRLGRTAEALAELRAAEAEFRRLDNSAAADECLLDVAWLAIERGEYAAAQAQFQAIGGDLRAQPWHRWRVDYGLGLCSAALGDASAALDAYYAAGAAVATMRRRLVSEHASSALFGQARRLYRDAIQLAARNGNPVWVAAFAEQQRSLLVRRRLADPAAAPPAIQHRREQAREQLQAAAASADNPAAVETALQVYIDALLQTRHLTPPGDRAEVPFDLIRLREECAQAYGSDWTMLAPIAVDADLHLLLITPTTIELTTQPYDAALRGLLARARNQRLRSEVYRDLGFLRGVTPRPWHDLHTLAERLLPATLHERLHPAHRLLIVPGGPFHALPWAALRLPDAWLAERAIIQYLPGLMPARVAPLDLHGPALLVGCATFAGRAADLPSALASLELVQAHWPGPLTRLEAEQATRDAMLATDRQDGLAELQLLHISSHAVAGEVTGLLGHVLLADTELWVDDIIRLNLDGGLVVLVACAGAASEVLPGDELIGVGRAFLAAGATGVLASFWPIYDRTVLPMVEAFYAELACHADPALALATMQRRLLNDPAVSGTLRMPFVWGCFGYTGVGVTPG